MRRPQRGRLLLLNIQPCDIAACEKRIPALFVLGFDQLVHELLVRLHSKGKFTRQYCDSDLPSIETVVNPNHQVRIPYDLERVLYKLLMLYFVGVEDLLDFLSRALLFHL